MTEESERRTGQQEILDALKKVDEKVTTINSVLVGNVQDDKPGLMERVRRLEDWVNNEKKLIYAISLIIIADVVMRLWGIITAIP